MVTALGEEAWRTLAAAASPLSSEGLADLAPMLILVPHPDDETLGCGGLLARAARAGLGVQIVYLTDGSASHKGSLRWPRSRLAALRRAEALGALAALGLRDDQVLFLNWPDAAPFQPLEAGFERTLVALEGLCQRLKVRSIFTPWGEEAHCDHRAAYGLGRELRRRLRPSPRRLEYLVWGWNDPGLCEALGEGLAWRLACGEEAPQRRRALRQHRSQLGGLITDDPQAFVIPKELAALASRPAEIFLERR